ncbi:MAG: FtsX-like permease family protein, partial [Spirochaetaceae bacterium]|nr:FtsX-like permease family protein [Spirochaetaceae bacterium]
DTVQFTVADGISFRIRAVPLTAVYEYAVENATLDKIVLIDAPTLRALLDMSDTVQNETIEEADFMLDDFDSLFDSASDTQAVVTETISDDVFENEAQEAKSASWNFIICRLKDAKDTKKVMHKINRIFKEKDYPAEAVNWRKSAGNTAIYLYWMRLILNVGIIIVLFSGFIVINNTLVINVLDRIREIGTMRAIGANKRFVSAMCMTETFIIACVAGVLGIIAGAAMSAMINAAHISFSNLFLIQLFGGARLVTKITAQNILHSAAVALILGLLSWIYPVSAALKAIPVQAMQGAK